MNTFSWKFNFEKTLVGLFNTLKLNGPKLLGNSSYFNVPLYASFPSKSEIELSCKSMSLSWLLWVVPITKEPLSWFFFNTLLRHVRIIAMSGTTLLSLHTKKLLIYLIWICQHPFQLV